MNNIVVPERLHTVLVCISHNVLIKEDFSLCSAFAISRKEHRPTHFFQPSAVYMQFYQWKLHIQVLPQLIGQGIIEVIS